MLKLSIIIVKCLSTLSIYSAKYNWKKKAYQKIPDANFSTETSRRQDVTGCGIKSHTPWCPRVACQNVSAFSLLDVCHSNSVVTMGGCYSCPSWKRFRIIDWKKWLVEYTLSTVKKAVILKSFKVKDSDTQCHWKIIQLCMSLFIVLQITPHLSHFLCYLEFLLISNVAYHKCICVCVQFQFMNHRYRWLMN